MINLKNAWVTQEEITLRENEAKEKELAKQNQAEELVALKALVQQNVQVNNALTKILVTSSSLSQEEKETFINSFEEWEKGKTLIQGTVIKYKGKLYEVQDTLIADSIPTIGTDYRPFISEDIIQEYQVMVYNKGEKVEYKGKLYESLVDNNMNLPTDKSNWKLLS